MSESQSDQTQDSKTPLFSEIEKQQQFLTLKAELEQAVADAEAGAFSVFNPLEFEPGASQQAVFHFLHPEERLKSASRRTQLGPELLTVGPPSSFETQPLAAPQDEGLLIYTVTSQCASSQLSAALASTCNGTLICTAG